MDNTDRLLDTMEHPEKYTPEELEAMLTNPEVEEVFEMLDKTKSALCDISTPDIEEEWEKFETRCSTAIPNRQNRIKRVFSRNIAASIIIGLVSVTALAAIVGVGLHQITKEKSEREIPVTEERTVTQYKNVTVGQDTLTSTVSGEDTSSITEVIIFDNDPLDSILNRISAYHGCEVSFNNEAAKSLRLYFRWNQSLPLVEVIERLNNFEQIHLTLDESTIKID